MTITCQRCGYKRPNKTKEIGEECPICHMAYPKKFKFTLPDAETILILISMGGRLTYILSFLYISIKALINSGIGPAIIILLIAYIFYPIVKKYLPYDH
jgi:hypothetical protein